MSRRRSEAREGPVRRGRPRSNVSQRNVSRRNISRRNISRRDVPHTKLVMVDFRSGETIRTHPEIAPHLEDGWHVQNAAPRVTSEGTRLLVVLTRFPPVV